MGKLKVLPAQIANMIAAGEVVQRPSSVVKELMENAVDAGATQVNVVITDAGRTLIQVIDNGCGMSPVDAVLCFERHATSKIATAEDLEQILTYGFRGEALASIAAVAEVTLRTRRPQDETGTEVRVGAFGETKTSTVAAPAGSNFMVRNLFFNTPARRKFLKSDNVEFKHILEEFTRVALTRPEIGFTLSHNGRDIYLLKKAKSLKFRVLDLMGSHVAGEIVDLSAETSVVRISGFVGRPDAAASIGAREILAETAAESLLGKGTCVGRPFGQIEWRIIPITDEPIETLESVPSLPPGEIGELALTGPQVTERYVTRVEANRLSKIRDSRGRIWHRIGDVGWIDDKDRFWFCGRLFCPCGRCWSALPTRPQQAGKRTQSRSGRLPHAFSAAFFHCSSSSMNACTEA